MILFAVAQTHLESFRDKMSAHAIVLYGAVGCHSRDPVRGQRSLGLLDNKSQLLLLVHSHGMNPVCLGRLEKRF